MEVREGVEECEISREANKVANRGQWKFLEFEKAADGSGHVSGWGLARKRQANWACLGGKWLKMKRLSLVAGLLISRLWRSGYF
jgi:hypothetical protein